MNVALPAAQMDLGFSNATKQWIVTLYALCFGALMIPAGRLGDVIGLRRCFVVGTTGFAAASLLGGLATNVPVLLTGRALQGATGALVASTGLALLSVMFPGGLSRARAFGVLGTVMGLGTAGSFLLAGFLVDSLSWRWTLLINIPIVAVVVTGLLRTAPSGKREPTDTARPRIDLVGAVLITAALASLVAGLDQAGLRGWVAPVTVSLILIGLLLTVFLIGWLRHTHHPLIPLTLITDQRRATAFAAVFVAGIGMFAGMFLLTNYLQGILGYSALVTGLAFLPFGVGAIVISHLLGIARFSRVRPRKILIFGLLTTASALAGFALIHPTSGYAPILLVMLLLGAGSTAVMVAGTGAATLGAGTNSGVAGALVNSGQQIGAALGTALLMSVAAGVTARRDRAMNGADEVDSVLHGYALAGALGAALTVVAAISIFLLGRRAEKSKQSKPANG